MYLSFQTPFSSTFSHSFFHSFLYISHPLFLIQPLTHPSHPPCLVHLVHQTSSFTMHLRLLMSTLSDFFSHSLFSFNFSPTSNISILILSIFVNSEAHSHCLLSYWCHPCHSPNTITLWNITATPQMNWSVLLKNMMLLLNYWSNFLKTYDRMGIGLIV